MRQNTGKQVKTLRRCFKRDHDRQVCTAPKTIRIGRYVRLDRPPMSFSAAEHMALRPYNCLWSVKAGTFKVVKVSPTCLTVEENGIQKRVSVDWGTVNTTAKEARNKDGVTQSDNTNIERDKLHENRKASTTENVADEPQEYVDDRIVPNVSEADNGINVVHGYSYTSAEYTLEPPEHIHNNSLLNMGTAWKMEKPGDMSTKRGWEWRETCH